MLRITTDGWAPECHFDNMCIYLADAMGHGTCDAKNRIIWVAWQKGVRLSRTGTGGKRTNSIFRDKLDYNWIALKPNPASSLLLGSEQDIYTSAFTPFFGTRIVWSTAQPRFKSEHVLVAQPQGHFFNSRGSRECYIAIAYAVRVKRP